MGDSEQQLLERHFRFALTRYSTAIDRVTLSLTAIKKDQETSSKRCRAEIRFRTGGTVVVEASGTKIATIASNAADRAGRKVARCLHRRRSTRTKHSGNVPRRASSVKGMRPD